MLVIKGKILIQKEKMEESICNFSPKVQPMYFATEIPVVQRTERCVLLLRQTHKPLNIKGNQMCMNTREYPLKEMIFIGK